MANNSISACPLRAHVDPRLVRFSAGATAVVLAIALLLVEVVRPLALGLLVSQVAVFAFTAFVSFQWSVWAQLYARYIWPRLNPPRKLDDAKPHRFAQLLGFVVTALAVIFFVLDLNALGYGLTGLALALAILNAATGVCLGCKLYPLLPGSRSA